MKPKKIAIQGVVGSFHEMAAYKYFGKNIKTIECDSFKLLCEKLAIDEADFAVMAIENTIAGSLLTNYALLKEYNFKIIGEIYLHIEMSLIVNKGVKHSDIEIIHSHPIALKQCEDYLERFENVKVIQTADTAESAKHILEKGLMNTAAIASAYSAEIYDMQILDRGIETNKRNFTRFLILSKNAETLQPVNKASICFELRHQVGALADVLLIMKDYEINMTKIQSVPILGKPYEYSFYVDLEWKNNANYEKAIHYILKSVATLSILGEYEKGAFHQSATFKLNE